MASEHVSPLVRVVGPSNSNFLIGYPGISSTLPRIEGKVEIRPSSGHSAPVKVSFVKIALQRRETVHPAADNIKKHLAAPRKEIAEIVGTELLLYRCSSSTEYDSILIADLPFCIFIPYGRGGEEHIARRVPPASLQLPSRTAETFYELLITISQSSSEQRKFAFPIPIARYDTLSTFGMYDRPESAEQISDHIVTLGISLPRWSFGPLDPVSVYIKLAPNPDLLNKAKKVTVKSITISIEEEVIFNHEGDEPQKKVKTIAKQAQTVGVKMPEAGYFTNLGLVFPSKDKDLRDSDGIIARGKKEFPMYSVNAFTTTGSLYKIQYYLIVKAVLSGARDITLKKPIVVCPYDNASCKELMGAVENAVADAKRINNTTPMAPAPFIVKANDPKGLRFLGLCSIGGEKKLLIE